MTGLAFLTGELWVLLEDALCFAALLLALRPRWGRRQSAAALGFAFLAWHMLYLWRFLHGLEPNGSLSAALVVYLLQLSLVVLSAQDPPLETFISFLLLSDASCLGFFPVLIVRGLLGGHDISASASTPDELPAYLASLAAALCLDVLAVRLMLWLLPRLRRHRWIVRLVALCGLFFTLALPLVRRAVQLWRELLDGAAGERFSALALFSLLCLLVLWLFLLKFLFDAGQKRELQAEKRLLEQQIRQQYQHFQELQQSREDLRTLRHDLSNHMQTIQGLLAAGQQTSAQAYACQLSGQYARSAGCMLCPHLLVDTVLSSKDAVCRREGICFDCQAPLPEVLEIDDLSLVCVLSNLLDNAIEACRPLRGDSPPLIRFAASLQSGRLVLRVENPCPRDQARDFLHTTKTEAPDRHGLGLRIVRDVAQRYDGHLELSVRDGAVVTLLMLDNQRQPQ